MKKPIAFLFSIFLLFQLNSQSNQLIKDISIRNIGPAGMSGRFTSIDVDSRGSIYAGAASGGVWKSEDGGLKWQPIFDSMPIQSIGAIKISPSNDDILWAGTGEGNPRNSHNSGAGIFKSLNGGKDWVFKGLEETKNIHRIIIDPRDENKITVGVLGSAWGDSEHRGVYQTSDGGETWNKILFAGKGTGCAELVVDPNNPNKMMASMWEFRRKPYTFNSGGVSSGIFMTIDGGKTWNKIEKGLPSGILGRAGLAISRSNPKVVYAMVESKTYDLFKSVDGGYTFTKMSSQTAMGNRPFYYAEIYVNPTNENHVYSLWSQISHSIDGGKNWKILASWSHIHPDHHALWINPENPKHMINGNDGGINITYDGGNHWRMSDNLPVGQFYHIAVDEEMPYHVYGGLQDNGSWKGPGFSFTQDGIKTSEWQEVLFGDGFDVQPLNGTQGYAMSQGGNIYYYDLDQGKKFIQPAKFGKTTLRFNWNAAIAIDEQKLFMGSQFVHLSEDKGQSWKIISPDLTSNDPDKLQQAESGGLTIDATNAENYCTITSLAGGKELLWAGTDDGNVWVRNEKEAWSKVSENINSVPKNIYIQQIHLNAKNEKDAWVVANNYRQNDWKPYLYHTRNQGKTWVNLVTDDLKGHALSFLQDPIHENLLFLGTDRGLYYSFDAGQKWQRLAQMPACPVQDLVHQKGEDDLVIGTFGRSIWIMDDLETFRTLGQKNKDSFEIIAVQQGHPNERKRAPGARFDADDHFRGKNKDTRATVSYHYTGALGVKGKVQVFHGNEAKAIRTFHFKPSKKGLNYVHWDFRRDGLRFPTYRKVKEDADLPSGIVCPDNGPFTLVLQIKKQKDTIVLNHLDTRASIFRFQGNMELMDSLKQITSKAFDVFEDLKAAKVKLLKYKQNKYSSDSLMKKVKKECKVFIGKIDTLQLLFSLPPSFTQYEEITPRLNGVLYQSYALLRNHTATTKIENSNAAMALGNASLFTAAVVDQINGFFQNTWQNIPFDTWDQWEKPERTFGDY
ncbi:MAG: hypothetical protein P8O20_08145 [Bacteroidia bacterium]|nr:hypothetical protein [Bacteroidia bacterium]